MSQSKQIDDEDHPPPAVQSPPPADRLTTGSMEVALQSVSVSQDNHLSGDSAAFPMIPPTPTSLQGKIVLESTVSAVGITTPISGEVGNALKVTNDTDGVASLKTPLSSTSKVPQQTTGDAAPPSTDGLKADSINATLETETNPSSKTLLVPDEAVIAGNGSHQLINKRVVPSLGAWEKPLILKPQAYPKVVNHQSDPLNAYWPSLHDNKEGPKKKHLVQTSKETPLLPIDKLPQPELKNDGSLRFPWAARMNPTTRNLYRAATPTYLQDGTPKVSIPSNVLLHGPEHQEEYVIGQFFRCSPPPGGLIHAVVNKLWGRSCRISCRKYGESSYLFHIPEVNTRRWVLQRGLWHIDDCLLFVAPWSPAATLSLPEISTIPVWANLKQIPDRLYSRLGISHIASGLGEPMVTNKPRLDPTLMGEAKIMVEVELDKPFPQKIALDDEEGNTFMVEVEYTWIPSKCGRCGHLGHKEKRCLLPKPLDQSSSLPQASSSQVDIVAHPIPKSADHTTSAHVTSPKGSGLINDSAKEKDISPNHNSSYVVVDTTPTFNHIAHNSGTIENIKATQQLMIPVMGLQVASAYSQKVPSHKQDGAHVSHPTTKLEINAPSIGLSLPTNDSSPILQEVNTPAQDSTTFSVLATSSPPLAASKLALPINNSMDDIPSPGIISKIVLDSGNENSFFNSQDVDVNFITTPSLGNVNEVESGNGTPRQVTLDDYFPTSRGGRTIKPTQKFQEANWMTVTSRRGRRGRHGKSH